jgi:hypothetical protein
MTKLYSSILLLSRQYVRDKLAITAEFQAHVFGIQNATHTGLRSCEQGGDMIEFGKQEDCMVNTANRGDVEESGIR